MPRRIVPTLLRASVRYRYRHLLRKELPVPLRDVAEAERPSGAADPDTVSFLALDFETTGLNPRMHRIVSAGWVEIRGGAVQLGTAREVLVSPGVDLDPSSVVIHGIGDDRAAGGMDEAHMLAELLAVLPGRVLVAHQAKIERSFLSAACRRVFGIGLPLLVVDTLALERRIRRRTAGRVAPLMPEDSERLDLASIRRRYGLPARHRHGALSDALAAAELLLVLCGQLARDERVALDDLL